MLWLPGKVWISDARQQSRGINQPMQGAGITTVAV
jgi:hypothetical protein